MAEDEHEHTVGYVPEWDMLEHLLKAHNWADSPPPEHPEWNPMQVHMWLHNRKEEL